MNKSRLTHTDLEVERKYEGNAVMRTGPYLSKLSFNDFKLDLLMDCPGDIVPFKWL